MGLSGSKIQGHWFLRLVKFIFFFVGPLGGILWIFLWGSHLTELFIFLRTDSAHRDLPKKNFSRFYQRFSQVPNFLTTFSPKVQISKFCSYKSMSWVQASMLKGFLWGLGTCHTFHKWVTKFSVFACPQLYIQVMTSVICQFNFQVFSGFLGFLGSRKPGNLKTWFQSITSYSSVDPFNVVIFVYKYLVATFRGFPGF